MFYERYIALCNKKGVSPSRAAIEAGISKSLVSKWKANDAKDPSPEVVRKLADYFGISRFEILEDNPDAQKEKPTALSGSELDRQLDGVEFALYGEVKDLTDAQKRDVLKFVQFLKHKED